MAIVRVDNRESFLIEGDLDDDARSIGNSRLDAFFFWGTPLWALLFVVAWATAALMLPEAVGQGALVALVVAVAILTFAHLIAVVPRAYLNAEVFASNRLKLTVVPVLLVAGLALSPALLLVGGILTVFWDVHHSALQTFGLARIYDMKAGNDANRLRRTDLLLNWALYVGPIAAGASLLVHLASLEALSSLDLVAIATAPGLVERHHGLIVGLAVAAWLCVVAGAAVAYRIEVQRGYRLPVHKAALLVSTGGVSIAAWGLAPPVMAFAAVNLFHAVQYFAIVWP